MIDLKVFQREYGILLKRFGRDFDEDIGTRYYEALSSLLTTDEFVAACKRAFVEEDFFPSPKKLVDMVKADIKTEALKAWEMVFKASANCSQPISLGEIGDRALRSIGGLRTVGYSDIYTQLPHLRKQFLEAYANFAQASSAETTAISGSDAYYLESREGRNHEQQRDTAA